MSIKSFRREQERAAGIAAAIAQADPAALDRLQLSAAGLHALALRFRGKIVLRGMPGYDQDRRANPLYPATPLAIMYCAVAADVRLALALAQRAQLWVSCRSGGHSTAGYSVNDGLVIDTRLLNGISIDAAARVARVGSGTAFADLNATLDLYQLHVPGGGCGDVCIAGYMQGGGYGFTSREYGMNCDNVLAATIMLADGSIVSASEQAHADLFWALRGGTGNNFGVLLEVSYRLHALYQVWGFGLQWPLEQAAAALAALQQGYMASGAPAALGHQVFLGTSEGRPALTMLGMFNGSRADGIATLAALRGVGSPTLIADRSDTYANLNEGLLDLMTPPTGNQVEFKRSGYIGATVGQPGWQQLIDCYRRAPNQFALIGLEVYGGAINAFAADGNAFVHRNASCNFFVDSFFDADGPAAGRAQALQWLSEVMGVMQPHFNGEVYQNYPVRDFAGFRQAYWGDAFPRLLATKQQYDPRNFFHFEQSISAMPL